MPKDDGNRLKAVELAKRLLVDAIWKTANIEVDGIIFPDAQEIFEGRAPTNRMVHMMGHRLKRSNKPCRYRNRGPFISPRPQ